MTSLLHCLANIGSSATAGQTNYYSLGIGRLAGASTEANSQITYNTAGTFSNLTVQCTTNGITAASTATSRVNAGAGNQTLSIPASTTGAFVDSSDSDTITSGAKVDCKIVFGSTGTSLTSLGVSVNFSATSGSYARYAAQTNGINFGGTASATYYLGVSDNATTVTSETGIPVTFRCAGTLEHGFVNCTANSHTASTFGSRISGSNGNISVSITASTTGIFEDTSHTDTISSGTTVDSYLTVGTGTGTLNLGIGFAFVPSTGNSIYPLIQSFALVNITNAASTSRNFPLSGGGSGGSPTEGGSNLPMNIGAVGRNSFYNVVANPGTSGSTTITLRKNLANANNVVTVPFGSTGYFEDTNDRDSIMPTDNLSYLMGNTTNGTVTFGLFGIHMQFAGAVVNRRTLGPRAGSRSVY